MLTFISPSRGVTTKRRTRWLMRGAGGVAGATGLILTFAVAAQGFGTYNSPSILGQQAEHERITRSLAVVGIEPGTLDLIAGKSGELGAVGAPDFLDNTSGLGPAKKHCDNGDFLDIPDYKQTRETADAAFRDCFGYFEQLLSEAVASAGQLVTDKGTINDKEARADFKVCSFPFNASANAGSAKCAVINRFGRALHIAEDFWSHTNWADAPESGQPISIKNPPGLGQTEIPAVLRFPGGSSASIPDGLISGCDDSVPVLGPLECRGRVSHSVLAKDNGTIDPTNCESASPTSKYARGTVVDQSGTSNFVLAVCGAMRQAQQTWADFSDEVIAQYGVERGQLILDVITNDSLPTQAAVLESESPTPSESESAAADDGIDDGVVRMADDADPEENFDSISATQETQSPPILMWVAIAMALAAVIAVVVARLRRRASGP